LEISEKVVNTTLRLIEEQRRGREVDHGHIKSFIESLCLIGFSREDHSQTLQVYQEHFEALFLEETGRFYDSERNELARERIDVYMKKVQERLDEEEERVRTYLHVDC
jgi:hypothetical protein